MPTNSKSRGWRPLAYPRLAFLRDGKGNFLFPFHPVMVTVLLRELLVLDGTLDRSTLAINREKQALYIHTVTGETKLMPQVEGHVLQQWQACELISTSAEKDRRRRRKQEVPSMRKRPCRCESHTATNEPSPNKTHAGGTLGLSPPCRVECSSGEDLVAAMLARWGTKDHDEEKRHTTEENIIRSLASFENLAPQAFRARKVSDLDIVYGGKLKTNLMTGMEGMTTANDIGRFANVMPRNGRFQLSTRDLPLVLEAGISTEESLRNLALIHCEDLLQSFSDDCLRKALGYKSSMVDRKKQLLTKLADYLFSTSHALFAWEQTQRDLQLANDRRTQAQRESYTREVLFDARTLGNLGGWEWSSLFRQAVQLLAINTQNWEGWARTRPGRKALAHHMSDEACVRVASRRRQGKRRSDLMNLHDSNVKEEDRQELAPSMPNAWPVSSTDELGFPPKPPDGSNTASSSVNSTSIRTVQLERKEGQSWGVLLSNEEGMCVVARGAETLSNGLHTGDVILRVDNEEGKKAQISYRQIVDIFKTSRHLTLKVERRQE
mmetsp:Transcript_22194/g.42119  ORF Transcript_22194/g.42119 Transcript_22194/m.42119 type:complete len:550 (+) Transcript_22194:178-1827(+)